MTATPNQDFTLFAGVDKVIPCAVVDANGDPYDLSGHSIYWAASRRPAGSSILSKNTSGGISITSDSDGEFEITFADTDTDTEIFTNSDEDQIELFHYCKVVDGSSQEDVVFEGKLTIKNNPLKAQP